MSTAIIRRPIKAYDHDAHVTAMWLMFCRAPRKAAPDVDGKFELGEVGEAPEKTFERLTPYSLARPK